MKNKLFKARLTIQAGALKGTLVRPNEEAPFALQVMQKRIDALATRVGVLETENREKDIQLSTMAYERDFFEEELQRYTDDIQKS